MRLLDLNARFKRHRREQVDPTKFVDGMLSPSGWRDYYGNVLAAVRRPAYAVDHHP